jgi:hypothetical protein
MDGRIIGIGEANAGRVVVLRLILANDSAGNGSVVPEEEFGGNDNCEQVRKMVGCEPVLPV